MDPIIHAKSLFKSPFYFPLSPLRQALLYIYGADRTAACWPRICALHRTHCRRINRESSKLPPIPERLQMASQ